jgi:hypothetical protein
LLTTHQRHEVLVMKTTPRPLGEVMDALGIIHTGEEGDLVHGAMVLLKIVDADGCVSLGAEWSPELSWLERVGMLREAECTERRRHRGR